MEVEYHTRYNGPGPFIVVWNPTTKTVEIYLKLYAYYSTLKT